MGMSAMDRHGVGQVPRGAMGLLTFLSAASANGTRTQREVKQEGTAPSKRCRVDGTVYFAFSFFFTSGVAVLGGNEFY